MLQAAPPSVALVWVENVPRPGDPRSTTRDLPARVIVKRERVACDAGAPFDDVFGRDVLPQRLRAAANTAEGEAMAAEKPSSNDPGKHAAPVDEHARPS